MVNHGAVRSTVKPKELVIDEFSAWVNSNITEINENIGEENEFIGYQYDCVQYEKDEYIKILSEDNTNLMLASAEIFETVYQENTNLMLAIAEVYESMNGGVV